MQVYSETKDPNETKDYGFDWTPQLGDGETVVSQVVVWVDAAGTTSPGNTILANISKVIVVGGNAGSRAIWTIRATTSAGNVLEESFGLDLIDSTVVATEVDRVKADLKTLYATRSTMMAGEAVIDLWRDGRRARRQVPTLDAMNKQIRVLEVELAQAIALAAGKPKRRPMGLAWRN